MTWHSATVPASDLAALLARIRRSGGTVAGSTPGADGVRVTWTTTPADGTASTDPSDAR